MILVKVQFKNRLIFDKHFFNDYKKRLIGFNIKPSLLIMLMRINDNSSDHKRCHNVMSKKTFHKLLGENPQMPRALLRASFKDYNHDEIELIEDDVERTIKLAIDLLEEEPNNSIIITSDSKRNEYESNNHFNNVRNVVVKSGSEAVHLIKSMFDECIIR